MAPKLCISNCRRFITHIPPVCFSDPEATYCDVWAIHVSVPCHHSLVTLANSFKWFHGYWSRQQTILPVSFCMHMPVGLLNIAGHHWTFLYFALALLRSRLSPTHPSARSILCAREQENRGYALWNVLFKLENGRACIVSDQRFAYRRHSSGLGVGVLETAWSCCDEGPH